MAQVSSIYNKLFLKNQNFRQKFHILLILTGKNASKWLEWYVFRVWGVPNPMAQVSSIYDKWFLKNQNFRQKFHILLILTGKNASKWLEWCMYLGFEMCQIQWHRFQVSTISIPEKSKFQAKISHFVDFDWEKCIIMAWVAHIRVWGVPNPMAQVSSIYDKWFLKNQNVRREGIKFTNHQNGIGPVQ